MYTSQKFNAVQVAELREKTRERLGQLNVFFAFYQTIIKLWRKKKQLVYQHSTVCWRHKSAKIAFFLVVYIGVYISIAGNCAGYIGLTAMCWRCGTKQTGHHF